MTEPAVPATARTPPRSPRCSPARPTTTTTTRWASRPSTPRRRGRRGQLHREGRGPGHRGRLNEAVGDGNTVIWTHGSQFYDATAKVATENPDVNFIAEYDGVPKDQPANVWTIDRQFHLGFYGMGVFASKLSKTGKVATSAACRCRSRSPRSTRCSRRSPTPAPAPRSSRSGPVTSTTPPRPSSSRTQLLGQGADVIVGSLNEGATGTFQAFEGKPEGSGWVTAKYTDKSAAAGSHYAGSLEYDFIKPLADVLAKIKSGTRTGALRPRLRHRRDDRHGGDNVPADVKSRGRRRHGQGEVRCASRSSWTCRRSDDS